MALKQVALGALLAALAPAVARAQAAPDAGAPPTATTADAGTPAADAGAPSLDAGAPPTRTAADAGAASPDAGAAPAPAKPQFEPPHPLTSTNVAAPTGAPAITTPVVVTVKLLVDATGTVKKVQLVTPPKPPFDAAVIAAARAFRFAPARYGGKPVPVSITFTHTFTPPPPPPAPTPANQGPPRTAVLRGRLIELGTRAPVASATVVAKVGGRSYRAEGDQHGHFRLALPPGPAKISVYAPSHKPFIQREKLAAHQALVVKYLVARDRYDPYEIVVVGNHRREVVSRITLRGPELKQVPGTFGDPFRVIQALPGVSSVMSLLPFPVVRGASPSSTGFLVDGIRVPLLFHLLAGPSVINPDFIDQIDFYPGGAPAPYGGYTAGIVDGHTVRAGPKDHLIDVDANLLQAGGLVREPIKALGATATVAARYGYPGLLMSLATNRASLSYWDYQARLDGGTKTNGWTLFAFGANDELDTVAATANRSAPNPPLTPALILTFHRLDLRYHRTLGRLQATARVFGGYDHTVSNGTDFSVLLAHPSLRARWRASDRLVLDGGLDGSVRHLNQGSGATSSANALSALTAQLSTSYVGSAFAEALWRPTPDWLIRAGARTDVYEDNTATKSSFDPRLTVRYKVGHRDLPDLAPDSDASAIWLKGALGIYHQPPRFVLPLPGLDQMPLRYGLLQAYQSSLGAEVPLAHGFQLSTDAYFNYMDPTIFDLSINAQSVGTGANNSLFPTQGMPSGGDGQQIIDRLTKPQLGRAYGLEFMLRRKARTGIYGWIAYTLSRSERWRPSDNVWAPYDFDRTQLLNLVVGMPLPRNWDVGLRAQYESGLPATTTAGYNAARASGYLRFDVRVDKRAVWRTWLLDFYVDVTNVALMPEEVTPGNDIRYVLPTVGLRGRF